MEHRTVHHITVPKGKKPTTLTAIASAIRVFTFVSSFQFSQYIAAVTCLLNIPVALSMHTHTHAHIHSHSHSHIYSLSPSPSLYRVHTNKKYLQMNVKMVFNSPNRKGKSSSIQLEYGVRDE